MITEDGSWLEVRVVVRVSHNITSRLTMVVAPTRH